ncbi:MAG: cell wall hydrolase [Holosporales bacterium]|jgi:spore germination cell wall hydrolase CwlJ-like protein|nr:cell wall hydrolase [Holosporales bacterium]
MNEDIEIMAKTMYGEARGEYPRKNVGIKSLIAIGNVIMNRSKKLEKQITEVCLHPKQFSCWNRQDPNRAVIDSITEKDIIFNLCFETASKIICEEIGDITNEADHYYSRFARKKPYWAENQTPVSEVGNHIFFKLYKT